MVYYAPGSEGAKRRDEKQQKQLETPLSEMMKRAGVTQKEVDDIRARSKRPMSDRDVVHALHARMPVLMSRPQQPMRPVQPQPEDKPPVQPQIGAPPDHTPKVPWEHPKPKPKPEPEPEPEKRYAPTDPSDAYARQENLKFQNHQRIKGWQDDIGRVENLLKVSESERLERGLESDDQLNLRKMQLLNQIQNTQKHLDQMPDSYTDPDPKPAPAPAPAPVQQAPPQQQPPPGLTYDEWRGQEIGLPDAGLPGSQPSMMDLWGGGGQQAPTQQWGGQQGWQRQEQGQTFQDPITGRTLDRRTGQPVEQQGPPQGHTRWADIPEYIRNSPEMKDKMSKGDWSPNESTSINLGQFLGANPHLAQQPQQQQWGGWQDFGGWQGWGGGQAMPGGGMGGGMGNMFPGMQMPGWATFPDSNLVGQPQQPVDPGYGTGQPGQNIPGAGVIPGLPPVSPVPGAAPELGQYGQEIGEAATAKLQQAPQSGVPSGSPVVYPSSQAIAPTTRQGGGGRRGGGGASPFSYGVRVK